MTRAAPARPIAVIAEEVPPPARQTGYPPPYAALVSVRVKRRLGDVFGLQNFGVNLTRLAPGGISALRHSHRLEDEFIYVLEGTVTLLSDDGDAELGAGHCAGFRAGGGSHQLVNRSDADAVYLEIGDRAAGEVCTYPDADLRFEPSPDGGSRYVHKDGSPY